MSYIDAYYDKNLDCICVAERTNEKRKTVRYPVPYTFYYADAKGKHRSIFDEPVTRVACRSYKEFQKEIKIHSNKKLYETDLNRVFECLAQNYASDDIPKLQVAFFDIEVDWNDERGFADPDDPFNKITAISVVLRSSDQTITLALPPKTLSVNEAMKMAERFDNTFIFEKEEEMLETFIDIIDDVDIISGWNSESYDIPYVINRIIKILGKDYTKKLCLWGKTPKKREFIRFGKKQVTYDLSGRLHLDYLQLYKKYTYHEMPSYKLDTIGEYEVGERKVEYEGSLDQLYNNDFEKFIEYNRQDTVLLLKIDAKLKFIDLVNTIAHQNSILLPSTMGTVKITDQAIINEAHSRELVVPTRSWQAESTDLEDGDEYDSLTSSTAAGAYVAHPKRGLHDWICAVDINSLYPSIIRALNMSPESIVGQIRPTLTNEYINSKLAAKKALSECWEGLFSVLEYTKVIEKDNAEEMIIDFEDGSSKEMTGAEIHKYIFGTNNLCISANGTIFDLSKVGIIPQLLTRWYAERKEFQAKKKAATTPEEAEYYDKIQLIRKIGLNSVFGAILNAGSRFHDSRIGQSITLTGRTITKHMSAKANEIATGEYDYKGISIIAGDTDSTIFTVWPIIKEDVKKGKLEWNKEVAITVYDQMAEDINNSFSPFMKKAFNVHEKNGSIIKAGREIVATKGLFVKKKKYAALIYDLEGQRVDVDGKPGKMKIMGLDIKRSDTPLVIQQFLERVLLKVLCGEDEKSVIEVIKDFRAEFSTRPGWEKGSPKSVNNLTMYGEKVEKRKGGMVPGHVTASLNWNTLRRMNRDNRSMSIVDGQKIIVCKMRNNPMGFTSVAYPVDEPHLPAWFKELPFDDEAMEQGVIDKKLENLIGVLNWNLEDSKISETFDNLFEME